MLHDLLGKAISRNPFRSQREACTVCARRSIAAFGPVHANAAIRSTCTELATGLYGEAYSDASEAERERMVTLMEEEYRKCIAP